ncbi:MAG: hypothetical protein HRT74_03105 [Flavobacteriales bacterium]|nr:hypothetical protein [Flavobacteriales bacterium]
MSNKASDSIFKLIKSMTKPEKRYFKVYSSKNASGQTNNYLKIFDAIDRQKEYNEEKLLDKFKDEPFINMVSITKNRLYQSILKSLDAYHSTSSVEAQIKRMLHCAEILFNKSLYNECRRMINSAKRLAEKHEKNTSMIEVRRWEKLLLEKGHYENLGKKDLNAILEEDQELLEIESNFNHLWNIKSRLFRNLYNKGQARSKKDQGKFAKIMDDLQLSKPVSELKTNNKYLYHHIHSAYHYALGEHKKSYQYLLKNKQLIKENVDVFVEEPNIYFSTLTNVINVAIKLGKTKDAFEFLEEMKHLQTTPLAEQNENTALRIFASADCTMLSLYAQTGQYEEGLKMIPEIEEGLIRFDSKLSAVRKATFYMNIAVLMFGMEQYNEALKWNNQLLNNVKMDKAEDLQCMALLFNLVIHLELENQSLVDYAMRSTKRFLETREKKYQFESLFLRFVNDLLKERRSKSEKELYQDLVKDLEALKNDPFEQSAYDYFNFEVWARSRISDNSFAEEQQEWAKKRKN